MGDTQQTKKSHGCGWWLGVAFVVSAFIGFGAIIYQGSMGSRTLAAPTPHVVKVPVTASPAPIAMPTATPRPTTAPTATSRPTNTATPIAISAKVKQGANGRSGPGTQYAIVAKLKAGDAVTVAGKNTAGDWYMLSSGAWVFGELLDLSNPTAIAVVTVAPTPTSDAQATRAIATAAAYGAALAGNRQEAPKAPRGIWCEENEGVAVCVGYFEYLSKIGYTTASSDSKFVALIVSVYNRTEKPIHVNPNNVTMVDTGSRTYSYSSETYGYGSQPMDAVNVQPGNTSTGSLVFLIDSVNGPAKIIYESFLGPTVTINIRRPPDKAEE